MIRQQLAEKRAAAAIQDKVDRLQDAIAGGGLDKIPADTGAVPAEGTLDARGLTASGDPAPLPGSPGLREALVHHAFDVRQGAPPSLLPGPDGGYYAVEVESVTPPRKESFDEALPGVVREWHDDVLRHEAETKAASVYAAASAAHALAPAATAAGLTVVKSAPFTRDGGSGVPPGLAQVVFSLKPGAATMLQTGKAFTVAVLTGIAHPEPSQDKQRFNQLALQLRTAVANDLEQSYSAYVMRGTKTKLNEAAVTRVLGQ